MEKTSLYDYARMCRTYATLGCYYCPLSHCKNGLNQVCGDLIRKHPDKANEIILKWCEEHPIETRQDRLLKMFPEIKMHNEVIDICPIGFGGACSVGNKCCYECKKEYWLAEVDE